MPHSFVRAISLSALLLANAAFAQRSWTVDPKGGGDFTSLPTALSSISAGDTLLVYTGNYPQVTLSRSVHLRAVGTPVIDSVFLLSFVSNTRITVEGFRFRPSPQNSGVSVRISGFAGQAHFERCAIQGMAINNSGLISLNDCTVDGYVFPGGPPTVAHPPIAAFSSHVVATHSSFTATRGDNDTPGLQVGNATLSLAGCNLTGSPATFAGGRAVPPGQGLWATQSRVWIEDAGGSKVEAGSVPPGWIGQGAPAIDSTSSIELDPAVQLTARMGLPAIRGTSAVQLPQPGLLAQGTTPGGQVQARQFGKAGDPCVLFFGLPLSPIPSPLGPIAIEPTTLFVAYSAVIPNTGEHRGSLPIPSSGVPMGLCLSLQSVQLMTSGIRLSPPAFVLVN
jgi:hypothetical protein